MRTVFLVCAALGATLLACQFLMSLIGMGDHGDGAGHDVHLDHGGGDGGASHDSHGPHSAHGSGGAWLFSILTFRSVVSGLTFFGLAGMAATSAGWNGPAAAALAFGVGFAAIVAVSLLMRGIVRLQDEGTVRIGNAVGRTGTVYLTIPGNKSGVGKVTLDLQNRSAEYEAVTFQEALPTGSKVVVVDVIGPETVEVIAAPQYGRMAHA